MIAFTSSRIIYVAEAARIHHYRSVTKATSCSFGIKKHTTTGLQRTTAVQNHELQVQSKYVSYVKMQLAHIKVRIV